MTEYPTPSVYLRRRDRASRRRPPRAHPAADEWTHEAHLAATTYLLAAPPRHRPRHRAARHHPPIQRERRRREQRYRGLSRDDYPRLPSRRAAVPQEADRRSRCTSWSTSSCARRWAGATGRCASIRASGCSPPEARRDFVHAGRARHSHEYVKGRPKNADDPDDSTAVTDAARAGADEDGLPIPRRYWSATAIWLALGDGRARRRDRQRGVADDRPGSRRVGRISVWIVNAYQLTITILLVAAGGARRPSRLPPNLHPRPRPVHAGIGGLRAAHSLEGLIVARAFQGVGAAGIMSMNAALVRATYPAKMLGSGHGLQCAGPVDFGGGRPDAGRDHSQHCLLAVAVPDQPADRDRGDRRRLPRPFPHAAGHGGTFDWFSALLSMAMMGCIIFGAETMTQRRSSRPASP